MNVLPLVQRFYLFAGLGGTWETPSRRCFDVLCVFYHCLSSAELRGSTIVTTICSPICLSLGDARGACHGGCHKGADDPDVSEACPADGEKALHPLSTRSMVLRTPHGLEESFKISRLGKIGKTYHDTGKIIQLL